MEIKEAYCSYELAELLKEKGFPQVKPVCGYFITGMVYSISINANGEHRLVPQYPEWVYNKNKYIAAPTHQIACAWLREVHKLAIIISPQWAEGDMRNPCKWRWEIVGLHNVNDDAYSDSSYDSFEEATESALKYSLENSI